MSGRSQLTTETLLERAHRLGQLGRLDEAYPLIVEALRSDPGDPYALLLLAACFEQQGRWADALQMLDLAVQRALDDPQVHRARSRALVGLGRAADGLAAADLARSLAPDDVRNELDRANALLAVGGTGAILAAARATARARRLDPESVAAHVTEARVRRRMAEFREARAAYLAALRLDPEDPEARYGLGEMDSERGSALRASAHLGGVLQSLPTNWTAVRAATLTARRALWLLTDLGCVLLLALTVPVGVVRDEVSPETAATAGAATIAVAGSVGVLMLLRSRLGRLSGPIRALLRANRFRFTFVTAWLRLVAVIVGILLIVFAPHPPEAVEVIGALLLSMPFTLLLVRWRNRAIREVLWLVRRYWFRLRGRLTKPDSALG